MHQLYCIFLRGYQLLLLLFLILSIGGKEIQFENEYSTLLLFRALAIKGGLNIFSFKDISIGNKYKLIKISISIPLSIILFYGIYDSKLVFGKILLMKINPIWGILYIFLFIILYYISIFVHEAGHYVALKKLGYKVKLIVVGPIIYTENNNSHSLKLNGSGLLIFGGCVIPKINSIIHDAPSLEKCVKEYIQLLYGGIIGTIILIISSCVFILANQYTLISMVILIINWPILLNLFMNNNLVFGDYCLIDLLKSEPEYLVSFLGNNMDVEYPLNVFIKEKMNEHLDGVLIKKEYNELIISLTEKIIDEFILKERYLVTR